MALDIAQVAARQLRDYDARDPGTIFTEGVSPSEEQAYAIQSEVCRLREQRGEAVVGYKIGCTSPAVQRQLGIDHPVFGRLFASERYDSSTELLLERFASPAIEGELAVLVSEDIPADHAAPDRTLRCVGGVFPVIELHHHVLRSSRRTAAELIANNAIHAGFVAPREVSGPPPSAELPLRISLGGETVAEVTYVRWPDYVAGAIADLSSLLAPRGLSLKAGHVVLTGSLAELFPVTRGMSVEVRTPGYGSVSATFVEIDVQDATSR